MGMLVGGFFSQGGLCSAGTSTIPNLRDLGVSGQREVGARWGSDGNVYYYEGADDVFPGSPNGGTWIGNCAASEYEGRWTEFGEDIPNSTFTLGVWTEMTSNMDVTLLKSNSYGFADVRFEVRRKSDGVLLVSDDFEMEVGDDSK